MHHRNAQGCWYTLAAYDPLTNDYVTLVSDEIGNTITLGHSPTSALATTLLADWLDQGDRAMRSYTTYEQEEQQQWT